MKVPQVGEQQTHTSYNTFRTTVGTPTTCDHINIQVFRVSVFSWVLNPNQKKWDIPSSSWGGIRWDEEEKRKWLWKTELSQKRSQWSQWPHVVLKGLPLRLGPVWETWGQTTQTKVKAFPVAPGPSSLPRCQGRPSPPSAPAGPCSSGSGLNRNPKTAKPTPLERRLRKHCRESRREKKRKEKKPATYPAA